MQDDRVDFLAYTNASREHIYDLKFYKGFHVVRDPRDVVTSAYFSHLHSHGVTGWPELEPHRKALQKLNKEEGFFLEMEFSRQEFQDMYEWNYDQRNVLEVKMENLIRDPKHGFDQILRFLDLLDSAATGSRRSWKRLATAKMNRLNQRGRRFMPARLPLFPVPRLRMDTLPEPTLAHIIEAKGFRKLSGGRKRGQENVKSHYRKGVPGDWRNHFSDAHVRYFKEHFGDLLIKLGYESDNEWSQHSIRSSNRAPGE